MCSYRGHQECWWEHLQRASDLSQTELTRQSAAKALHLAGPRLVLQNVDANLQKWHATLIWYVLFRKKHFVNAENMLFVL